MSPAIFLLPWNPTYKLSLWRFPILSSNSLSTDPWLRESHVLRIALAPINSHWELRTLETVSVPKHKSMLHFLRTCGSWISATLWNHDGESFKEYTLFNMFSQYLEAWAWRGRVFGFDLLDPACSMVQESSGLWDVLVQVMASYKLKQIKQSGPLPIQRAQRRIRKSSPICIMCAWFGGLGIWSGKAVIAGVSKWWQQLTGTASLRHLANHQHV